MSATPIPRSLQMSLAGLRDISVIETAPEGRRPVRTYVGEFDETLVRQALERERARGGQAFYLHNRVETIDEVAERLRGLCPGCASRSPTGSSRSSELESRMMSFLRGDADVLVCTSIIESGIDIPAANTLIVERADHFGLAQLYQIRGRVGRSRERAYAYMLYDAGGLADARGARSGWRRCRTSPSSARGSRSRCATSSCAAPATCSATSSRAMSRRSASSCTCRCSTRRSPPPRRAASRGTGTGSRCASTSTSTPTFRRTTSATSRPRSTCTGGSPGPATSPTSRQLREELDDRFGPPPEPVEHLLALQRARIKLGAAGARAVSVRGGRLVDRADRARLGGRARTARVGCRTRSMSPGARRFRCAWPRTPSERFPDILAAADAVLAATGTRE